MKKRHCLNPYLTWAQVKNMTRQAEQTLKNTGTIAGALRVAPGGQAMRVAPQRVDGGKQEAFVCSSPPRGANYSVSVSPLGGLGS